MPGRVDQIELVVAPVEARGRRLDGDAALALLLQVVHHRVARVD